MRERDFVRERDGDVVFVGHGNQPKTRVELGVFAQRGPRPLGWEKMLDACNLNNSSMWCASLSLFSYGVLVPRPKFKTETNDYRIGLISNLYPVNDKVKALGVALHEKENLRGFTMVGDDLDIASFWAAMYEGETAVRGWDVVTKAMCWTASAPGTVFVPYVDFDEKGGPDDFHRVYTERFLPAVALIQANMPASVTADEKRAVVFFNSREDGPLWKYSFHVHWPSLGVENIMDWKRFLLSISDMPRKLIWKKEGERWLVTTDERISMFDPAVYGGRRQLFRGPFCGKMDNASAVMTPLCPAQGPDGRFHAMRRSFTRDEMEKYILQARIARWPTGLVMLNFQITLAGPGSVLSPDKEVQHERPPFVVAVEKETPMTIFLEPLLRHFILPKWQEKRKRSLLALNAKGAVVPVSNLVISRNVAHPTKPGVRHLTVDGDTFCLMDTDHVHTRARRDVVGISIDFMKATIQQNCHACGRKSEVFCFLHQGNQIEITPEADSKFTAISHWETLNSPYQFILDYFPDLFLLQRGTRTVWVYDRANAVWRTDVSGNVIIGQLVDELNSRFLAYLQGYKKNVVAKQIHTWGNANQEATRDEIEAFVLRVHEEARKFMAKNTPFIKVSATARGKMIEDIRSYNIHREAREMNIFPHLVPMKNKMCVNVFTMETKEMLAEHFFTSCVDAELVGEDTDEVKEILAWFDEISTGDAEKCKYFKRFAGYCFTFLIHDRKFLVCIGCGKNGKGAYKQFIMDISKGPEGFESRAKNLLQNFWDRRGNSNTGPEQATPESYELLNRTFFYTDDILPIPLDANKVKRLVAHEEGSGRGLWGKPVDIKPKGKVMWTTNFNPNGPGEDNAFWERLVVAPMLTKYVPVGCPVDPSRFRFQQNSVRYLQLLEMRDAFFSITIRALAKYYQELPWDAVKQQPAVLASFPIPASMELALTEARAQQLPLAAFMKEYTKCVIHPLECVRVEELFQDYITFLGNMNEVKAKRDTTQTSFVRLLASALDVHCTRTYVEGKGLLKKIVRHDSFAGGHALPAGERSFFGSGLGELGRDFQGGERGT